MCYENQSVIKVFDNLIHNKIKHVELSSHYSRQSVQDKGVSLVYCRTNDQVVDIFTKPLSEAKFIKFRTMLGL